MKRWMDVDEARKVGTLSIYREVYVWFLDL